MRTAESGAAQGVRCVAEDLLAPTPSSQAAGGAFIERLAQRTDDLDPAAGPDVVAAQIAAFREWEQSTGTPFDGLKRIAQPTLVINGIHDDMIPVSNSYRLAENLPNAVLLVYPDAGHGSFFSSTTPSRGRLRHSSHRIPHSPRTESAR